VFSGGKLEFRKGQDLVVRAFKVLQDRHDDVLLVAAWSNPWPGVVETMRGSPYVRFSSTAADQQQLISDLLAENGIDLRRVVILGPKPNGLMARIYRNSDVGLFPNRCEGGTNLVMMEYMACGKPVLASDCTGHRDVINEHNAVLIKTMGQVQVMAGPEVTAVWDDPDLDETVERLEWCYQHRSELATFGAQAGKDLAQMTWASSARRFYELLGA
jgi:glycosyltransferase involved in cell wall biosynthesis